ncbi:MAG: dehydrogenase, short-chain alcohol dehydrogenase like [Acidimicrobiaceae bacterium]|jgi:NAD(P)-dependent dehydrogenase (short-subunit alcohol dehydrogenase family)|nr:dehydrogenase, short-chain alcohol dehydrogenase like [Acidimicrobiaceae bacterium]
MGELDGRVAIITGAGRGLGRAHALLFAAEGARVVVNDRGAGVDGTGDDRNLAADVVDEIRAAGGTAVASTLDVAEWATGEKLIAEALDAFGDLHVLVNNAGILRDRALVNMTEQDWDVIMQVDLKGHFVPTRFAAAYWRQRAKAGDAVQAAVVNTVSTSGLVGNPGQSHYGTAKAGIAAFTIICAQELARYGVRVNAISPSARTRMTETSPGLAKFLEAPDDPNTFDTWDPANVSPLVAYLASSECDVTGRVFQAQGGKVQVFEPWTLGGTLEKNGRWTIEELAKSMPSLLG